MEVERDTANIEDVAAVVALLTDDPQGATREGTDLDVTVRPSSK